MREIKFRIWNTKGKNWYTEDHTKSNFFNFLGRTEEPIVQFTGLKDKNGKEIYEGDIVKAKDYSNGIAMNYKQPEKIETVKWSDELAQFIPFGFSLKDSEVIGNIYENPELLK